MAWVTKTYVFFFISSLVINNFFFKKAKKYGRPIPQGYVPLNISLETNADVSLDSIEFPQTESYKIDSLDETFNVLPSVFTLKTLFRSAKNPQLGDFELTFKIEMQACDDKICFPPQEMRLTFPFHVSRSLQE
jgi:hypothetical protein